MYLQLAENSDYTPLETNQGTLYVRNDMLSEGEDTTLSAKGALIQKAAPIISKAAPIIGKAAPIVAKASPIVGQALPIAKAGVAKVQASRAAAGKAPIIKSIGTGIKKLVTSAPKAAIVPAAAAATAAAAAEKGSQTGATQADAMGVEMEKQSFFKKYRMPLLIGGGILAAGTILYLVTRKK